ncbi:FAD binding domain-containing protein [Ditylenchus destructor]|nr:FAD binding domain-containing protein [Ditylenchus destructor]
MVEETFSSAFPKEGSCLLRGSNKISSEVNLRVPVLPKSKFSTSVGKTDFVESSIKWQNGCRFPGAYSDQTLNAKVVHVGEASKSELIRKPKRYLDILLSENDPISLDTLEALDAGDSFYFLFRNPQTEVDIILDRLAIDSDSANKELRFHPSDISADSPNLSTNFSEALPFIPNPCSANYLLSFCLDIRRSPNRPLLRALAECTDDPKEQRRLLELCSVQGGSEFTEFVRTAGISLVDLLLAFPNCRPPLARLAELVPRLLPRAYTACNHKSQWSNRLKFVYSLLETQPTENGIYFSRFGVCSGWLNQLQIGDTVNVILKEPSKFRLPPFSALSHKVEDIVELPLIMVGPGTGVAPFIAFLEKIKAELKSNGGKGHRVKRILLYGSSNLDEEFLFRDAINSFVDDGIVTDLILCESRPAAGEQNNSSMKPKYVYDGLKSIGRELAEWMISDSLLFACGDVKAMSKGLWACLAEILKEHQGYSAAEAMEVLKCLRQEERLIEDVWS